YRFDNLTAMVDVNGLGQSQRTMYGHDAGAFATRFAAFGWHPISIDGHDMAAIVAAFDEAGAVRGKPVAIIARTNKGQGVSFLADRDNWHGKAVKKGAELDQALEEIRAAAPAVSLPPVATRGGRRSSTKSAPPTMPPPEYKLGEQVATREAYGT